MSKDLPELEDYVHLFRSYERDIGALYAEPDDDRYALLFEQVIRLLIKPSQYNLSIPKPFRISAQRYHQKDPTTLEHLHDPANRHFMLCDLHDWIMLNGGLALMRKAER
ncbi:MAG: hypothetical protein AAFR90_13875 [Pseudomonadota bacterium]